MSILLSTVWWIILAPAACPAASLSAAPEPSPVSLPAHLPPMPLIDLPAGRDVSAAASESQRLAEQLAGRFSVDTKLGAQLPEALRTVRAPVRPLNSAPEGSRPFELLHDNSLERLEWSVFAGLVLLGLSGSLGWLARDSRAYTRPARALEKPESLSVPLLVLDRHAGFVSPPEQQRCLDARMLAPRAGPARVKLLGRSRAIAG